MRDKIIGFIAVVALILAVGIVGSMDLKIMKQEQAWEESVQAWGLQQEDIQNRIQELHNQYDHIEDMYIAQGIWINDIRERLHFEWMDELEQEMMQE